MSSPPPLPPASEIPLAEPTKSEIQTSSTAPATVPLAKNGDWTAIYSPEHGAYYFWNSKTQKTSWENPLEAPIAPPLPPTAGPSLDRYEGIDPDLAYLDPSYISNSVNDGTNFSTSARFNSRTGRFQGDPSMNPDRISDYNRSERQQEAFYDTKSWSESLGGRGLGKGYDEDGKLKKKPSAKQVVS